MCNTELALLDEVFGIKNIAKAMASGCFQVDAEKVTEESVDALVASNPRLVYDDGVSEEDKEEGTYTFLQYKQDDNSLFDICIEWFGCSCGHSISILEYVPDGAGGWIST